MNNKDKLKKKETVILFSTELSSYLCKKSVSYREENERGGFRKPLRYNRFISHIYSVK